MEQRVAERGAVERSAVGQRVAGQVVAFQGERGAYSEEALVRYFGELEPGRLEVLPCRTFRDVFDAINRGDATDGLIPIENSLAGSINDSYDLLLNNDLKVYGEVILPVNHYLLAPPGATLGGIRRVYSHPQALAQCDVFLGELGAEVIVSYDTAGSAKMVAESGSVTSAAIASRRSADIYGLTVLAERIQSLPDNFTRFYAIGRKDGGKSSQNKTVLVMATKHLPGALYWCLGAIACRGINMTKLESRPSRNTAWEYTFFLDLEAHISDPVCIDAIEELRTKTLFLRVLGSFPAAAGAEHVRE